MKSIQLIKQVNNTELGKSGTHETYILIPQDLDISNLFVETNKEYEFEDKISSKKYKIRLTSGREKRIVGMGPFYRDNDVMAGDKILLEKRIVGNSEEKYFVSVQHYPNIVFFQKVKEYFEALTPDRISIVTSSQTDITDSSVRVEYHGEVQKRNDSPVMTKVYNIFIGGKNIKSKYQDRDMIGLKKENEQIVIDDALSWKKYIIEVNDNE